MRSGLLQLVISQEPLTMNMRIEQEQELMILLGMVTMIYLVMNQEIIKLRVGSKLHTIIVRTDTVIKSKRNMDSRPEINLKNTKVTKSSTVNPQEHLMTS